jgi:phosphatidyl-myo-inositol dimannoside synthase
MIETSDGLTGVTTALTRLLDDHELRRKMGEAGRRRAEAEFSYDLLARRLGDSLSVNW